MFLAMQLPHTPFDGDNVEESFKALYANGSAFLDEERYQNLTTYDKDSEDAKTNHIGVRKIIICRLKIFIPSTEYILKWIFWHLSSLGSWTCQYVRWPGRQNYQVPER